MRERKFWLFLITLIVFSVALLGGKVTGTEYTYGIVSFYGLFILGNAAEHYAKKSIDN